MGKPNQELCSIRIMFPVESDEQAIGLKRKIDALLAEVSDAQIQFSLANMPTGIRSPNPMDGLRSPS